MICPRTDCTSHGNKHQCDHGVEHRPFSMDSKVMGCQPLGKCPGCIPTDLRDYAILAKKAVKEEVL